MISIQSLPVGKGDCFILTFKNTGYSQLLVIDSGFPGTYGIFKKSLFSQIEKDHNELRMLLTHIDRDHIGGYKALFKDSGFSEKVTAFYYNTIESLQKLAPNLTSDMVKDADHIILGAKTSYGDAVTLENLLKAQLTPVLTGFESGCKVAFGSHVYATVLSPSPSSLAKYQTWVCNQGGSTTATAATVLDYAKPLEDLMDGPFIPDKSITNVSSISILLEAYGRRLLFLGDAQPEDIVDSLLAQGYSEHHPLEVDVVKISHHGSKHNTSPDLLRIIHGKYFLISGNGTPGHPDKEALSRIIKIQDAPILYFNYDIVNRIFTPSEIEKFNIHAEYEMELVLE